jgi:sulfur carrier protein
MLVNGKKIDLRSETPVTLAAFLKDNKYEQTRVAVEKNGSIVPRAAFECETLCDSDKVEIVHFVGGG